jgi:hypothetical protein
VGFNPHPARRPGATELHDTRARTSTSFNPHPARRPDATELHDTRARTSTSFNPHPARRPGATQKLVCLVALGIEFQSSPGSKAGCNGYGLPPRGLGAPFQSSPGSKAGCNGGFPSGEGSAQDSITEESRKFQASVEGELPRTSRSMGNHLRFAEGSFRSESGCKNADVVVSIRLSGSLCRDSFTSL